MIPAWLTALLKIAAALVETLGRFRREQEKEAHQDDVDDLQQDPGGFLDRHFNGRMRDPAGLPGDAGTPGQADLAQPDGDGGRGSDIGQGGH